MQQSDLVLDKYWVTQSGYFRLATTVALGVSITDEKFIFCHGISEWSVDKKNSTRNYNNRKVYDCFNNPFPVDFGKPYLNLPPIIIDDRPHLNKRDRCTPDFLPDVVYFASGNYVSDLTITSDYPRVPLINSDDPKPPHSNNKDESYSCRVKIGYCCRKYGENMLQKDEVLLIHMIC